VADRERPCRLGLLRWRLGHRALERFTRPPDERGQVASRFGLRLDFLYKCVAFAAQLGDQAANLLAHPLALGGRLLARTIGIAQRCLVLLGQRALAKPQLLAALDEAGSLLFQPFECGFELAGARGPRGFRRRDDFLGKSETSRDHEAETLPDRMWL